MMEVERQKIIFKARTDTLELNSCVGEWKNISVSCEKCGEDKKRLEHVITEREWYERERHLDKKIKKLMGENIWEEEKKRKDGGMSFLLGFKNKKHSSGE